MMRLFTDSGDSWKMSKVAFPLRMQTLQMLRPDDHDFDLELKEIQKNARETREESFRGSITMLYSRAHWKQAVAALLIPWFQQFSGINSIMFYGKSLAFSARFWSAWDCTIFLLQMIAFRMT